MYYVRGFTTGVIYATPETKRGAVLLARLIAKEGLVLETPFPHYPNYDNAIEVIGLNAEMSDVYDNTGRHVVCHYLPGNEHLIIKDPTRVKIGNYGGIDNVPRLVAFWEKQIDARLA